MLATTTVACAMGAGVQRQAFCSRRACRGKPSAEAKAYMHAEASLLLMTSMRAKATLLLKAMQRQAFCSNLERVYAIGVVVLGLSLSARSTSLLHTSLAFCFLYAKPMSTLSPIRGNNLNLWSQK